MDIITAKTFYNFDYLVGGYTIAYYIQFSYLFKTLIR